jgi:hypothetical protein
MGLNYFASSPVLIPPSPSVFPQPTAKRHVPKYPQPPSLNYLARTSNGLAGRKRSRDEDHDVEPDSSSRPIALPAKPEPIMGPGMTLIYPDEPSLNISPESQSGTWMEERAESSPSSSRPQLIARKSRCRIEDLPELPDTIQNNEIDPLVRQLGIGWKRLSETQQSAIAGSETYIRKQFDLNNPHVILHHEGLSLYVVESVPVSAQGYWPQFWLFHEDLRSCRFLCNEDSQLLERLNNKRQDERGHWVPNIRCEGPEVLAKDAKSTPIFNEEVFSTTTNTMNAGSNDMMRDDHPMAIQEIGQQSNEDVEMEGVV